MECPTPAEIRRHFAGPFDAKLFGTTLLALEERGYTDAQMYRMALAGSDALSRNEWTDRVARAREALPFGTLKRGDQVRAGGRKYTVAVVDHHAGLVEFRGKSIVTLMPHATEPGKFVISSARASRTVDGWVKVS